MLMTVAGRKEPTRTCQPAALRRPGARRSAGSRSTRANCGRSVGRRLTRTWVRRGDREFRIESARHAYMGDTPVVDGACSWRRSSLLSECQFVLSMSESISADSVRPVRQVDGTAPTHVHPGGSVGESSRGTVRTRRRRGSVERVAPIGERARHASCLSRQPIGP